MGALEILFIIIIIIIIDVLRHCAHRQDLHLCYYWRPETQPCGFSSCIAAYSDVHQEQWINLLADQAGFAPPAEC